MVCGKCGTRPDRSVAFRADPEYYHIGNLDNKELVAGSTLYLPMHVPGALFSVKDGHTLRGDGEVMLTALETSLRGTI